MVEKRTLSINNLPLISCDENSAVDLIVSSIINQSKSVFIHVNIYNYYILHKVIPYIDDLLKCSRFFFEGIGMRSAFYCFGYGKQEAINGTDLSPALFQKLSDNGMSVFLVGSSERVINKARTELIGQYPELLIADIHHGYIDKNRECELVESINNSESDLLVLGMGMKREIDFLSRNYQNLKVKAIWTVGGLFDFVSGDKKRAPLLIRRMGLEWLYRFFRQPINKFKRNFIIPFWFFPHFGIQQMKINRRKNID